MYRANDNRALSVITGIDLTATGLTALYTVPTGKTLIPVDLIVRITASTGFTTPATVRAGITSSYNEIVAATVLTGVGTSGVFVNLSKATALQISKVFAAGDVINLDITVGATATQLTAEARLYGILV